MAADPFVIFVLLVVVLAVITIFSGVKSVPQGSRWTVERFGRYVRTLAPGLNLIVPFLDKIGAKLSVMETVLDVPSQEVITSDNAMITADGVVFYQVIDPARAAYEVNDLERATLQLTTTNIRSVMGSMELDQLLSNRDIINAKLLTAVDEATEPWGVKITRIEIRDITPPRDLVDAMGRQMKAERDRRATILEADGDREAAIKRAEGEKQAAILTAEGAREAAFREAEARERLAEAEARATEMVSQAIATGDVQAINYFVAQRYIEALQAMASAPNQRVVLMPLEASSVIGALGGITELARATFGPGGGPGTGTPPAGRPGGGQSPSGGQGPSEGGRSSSFGSAGGFTGTGNALGATAGMASNMAAEATARMAEAARVLAETDDRTREAPRSANPWAQ